MFALNPFFCEIPRMFQGEFLYYLIHRHIITFKVIMTAQKISIGHANKLKIQYILIYNQIFSWEINNTCSLHMLHCIGKKKNI